MHPALKKVCDISLLNAVMLLEDSCCDSETKMLQN